MFLPHADPELVERIARDMAEGPPEVGVGAMEGFGRWIVDELPGALSRFEIPVGMIQSELNRGELTAVDSVGTAHGPLRIRLVPQTGHFPMLERPTAFNRALGAMLDDWTGSDGG